MSAALRVFIFFSAGYFVSYLFRGLNIGFAPFLAQEMGMSAADLGSLTSLYFLGFAATQIPAGAALDTWGPRRVTAVLMLVAALGSLLFGLAGGLTSMMLGRFLIGAGVSVCMGAGLQALAQNFPARRIPFLNGALIAIGGLGGVIIGTPLAFTLEFMSWRDVSVALAVFTTAVAVLLWVGAPDAQNASEKKERPSVWAQFQGTWQLLCSGSFWKLTLFPTVCAGMFYGVQSLWMKPYLLDVSHASVVQTDALISMLGMAAVCGTLLSGAVARRIERLGMSLTVFSGVCLSIFVLLQIIILLDVPLPKAVVWAGFGVFGSCAVLVFAVLVAIYPANMWGRVNTTYNMLIFFMVFAVQNIIGWVVELWEPLSPGVYPVQAHMTAWIGMLVAQVLCGIWYFWPSARRTTPAPAFPGG